jgi:hypothetical protein
MARTMWKTTMCIVTLAFNQWPWILGSSVTILWNIIPIHTLSENLCPGQCGTIKIPPCSKAMSAEHRPKFCSSSPAMVTFPYKWKILERDVKLEIINQSNSNSWTRWKVIARTMWKTTICIVTLTFDQRYWIKVLTLPWVQCNNSVKYYSNPCLQWKLMARTMFTPLWA